MATNPRIRLQSFDEVGPLRRNYRASSLVEARWADSDIEQDLPLAALNYKSGVNACLRLGYITPKVRKQELQASFIRFERQTIGVASAVPEPLPVSLPWQEAQVEDDPNAVVPVEIDFWHRDLRPDLWQEVDNAVVTGISQQAFDLGSSLGYDSTLVWQLVPPTNAYEMNACEANEMERIGNPAEYITGDLVTVPRQLWVRYYVVPFESA